MPPTRQTTGRQARGAQAATTCQARVRKDAKSSGTAERAAVAGASDGDGPVGRSASAATGGGCATRNIHAPPLTSTRSACRTVHLPTNGETTSGHVFRYSQASPVTRDAGLGRYLCRSRQPGQCNAQLNSKSDDTSEGNGSASETTPFRRYKKHVAHRRRLSLPWLQRFSIKHNSSFIMRTVKHALKEEVS